ncbi:FG-GAP repeat domain-containing protein [Paraliomyxa miuraensis]|uniref:FG-GAP repeat domain-containing protein n=1 Tax=Paraliomyxa miuraensis TaxID=376150 RepID=UPI00224F75A2|nr:VCBS repeat-containing protein [Paraliomyxa miuraensis]MCX4243929.1 VCBS repeat-containing protein [Paraliomyxa miuraensis]
MRYERSWVVGGVLLLAGCTEVGEEALASSRDDFELAAEPSIAQIPIVTSIPLGLWFTPMALEKGDFDGDGDTDLLVTGVEAGVGVTGAVFLGDGAGGFAAAIDANFTACSAFPVAGDVDGDGRTDVVTVGCANDLAVLLGQANGTLAPWSAWPAVEYTPVASTVIADFEGDGDSDVMTMRKPDSVYLDIALGNGGEGIWRIETTEVGNAAWSGFDPSGLALGHFDDDGLLDAALIEREHDIVFMQGLPPATFGFQRELGVDIPPWSNRVGDMDDDGYDDLVVSSRTMPSVQTLLADGVGDFSLGSTVILTGFAPYDTAVGDITGDGIPDVAMVDDAVAQIQWLRGNGAGGLLNLRTFTLPSPAIRIHSAHVDGDNREDLIAATFADDSITLVLSNN